MDSRRWFNNKQCRKSKKSKFSFCYLITSSSLVIEEKSKDSFSIMNNKLLHDLTIKKKNTIE